MDLINELKRNWSPWECRMEDLGSSCSTNIKPRKENQYYTQMYQTFELKEV